MTTPDNAALLACGQALDNLAGVIRKHGTCSPGALELIASRIRELATQPCARCGELEAALREAADRCESARAARLG